MAELKDYMEGEECPERTVGGTVEHANSTQKRPEWEPSS